MNQQLSSIRRTLVTLPVLVAATAIVNPAAAQKVTASLNVGTAPYAIAVNASTNKVYVTDTALNQVAVINGSTNGVTTVPVGVLPQAIAVNPVSNKIYVANSGGLLASNTLTVIDGSSNVTTTLSLGAGSLQPDAIAINPTTNKVYVATYAGAIAVVDGASNAITTVNAAAGTNPVAISVDVSTNKVYVACTPTSVLLPATATLTVIDGASNTTATVAAGLGLFDVQVNASLNQVFLGSVVTNTLTELSAVTNATLGSIAAGAPKCIAVNPNTGIVYYVSSTLGNIVAYTPASGTSVTLSLAASPLTGPEAIAIDASRNKIYVASTLGIAAIDGATNAVTPVLTGLASSAITVNPTTGQVYVADALGQLTVVDPLTTHFAVTAAGPATVGTPLTVTVTALDATGATVSGYVGTVHLSSSDLSATLPANKMLSNGSASFSVKLNDAGSATVSANDILATTITGSTSSIAVTAAATPTPTPTPVTSTPTPTPTPTPTVTVPTPTPTPIKVAVTVSTGSDTSSSGGSASTTTNGGLSGGTDSGGTGTVTVSTGSGVTPTPTPVTSAPVTKALAASQQVLQDGVLVLTAEAPGADTFQWYFDGVPLVNGGNVSGAQTATLMIVDVSAANVGNYSYTASNALGMTTSTSQAVSLGSASNAGRLVNISCRSHVGTGGDILIAGFIVGGDGTTGTESLLVRASGPALAQFGLVDYLPDPALALYSGESLIASDSQWAADSTINAMAAAVGAFQWTAASGQNSALLQSLPNGAYTAQVTGKANDTGEALAEVYDATPAGSYTAASPRLVNISARVQISAANGPLIAGFVVGGSTSCTVMVRATGPGLAGFGITNYLPDPKVDLYSGSTVIASNSGWDNSTQVTWASAAVGAFPWDANTPDAAVLMTLAPGAYTAQVSGVSGDSGVALVEVYEVR